MALFTYDAAEHFIIMGGVPLKGVLSGSSSTFETPDRYTKTVDVDGAGVTRNKTNDRTQRFTITLSSGSPSNDFLSGLMQADDAANAGVVSFMVKDRNSRMVISSQHAWVARGPQIGIGAEDAGREYIIDLGVTNAFYGGAN